MGFFDGLRLGKDFESDWCEGEIFQNSKIINEIKMLENHADFLTGFYDVFVGQKLVSKINLTGGRLFEAIDGAAKSRFAGAGRTEDNDFFALEEGEIDAF